MIWHRRKHNKRESLKRQRKLDKKRIEFLEDLVQKMRYQNENLGKEVEYIKKRYDVEGVIAKRNKANTRKVAELIKPLLGKTQNNYNKTKREDGKLKKRLDRINRKVDRFGVRIKG